MRIAWSIAIPATVCLALLILDWRLLKSEAHPTPFSVTATEPWEPERIAVPPVRRIGIDLDALGDTTARPLFSATRRPPPKPEPPVAAETPPPQRESEVAFPELKLKGVLFARDMRRILLVGPELPDGRWVGIGDTILGWDLAIMTPEGATFRSGDRSHQLKLYESRGSITIGARSSP